MKLLRARFSSYKSVVETELTVDPRITVLVGANEGGKTNVLKGLESFNLDQQLSESSVCQFSDAYKDNQSPELQLLFGDFSPAERDKFNSAWQRAETTGLLAIAPPTDPEEQNHGRLVEKAFSGENPDGSKHEGPSPPSALSVFNRVTVTRQGNGVENFFVHIGESAIEFPDETVNQQFTANVLELLPRFLYFEDINLLRGEVSLEDLLGDDPAFQTERNLLGLGSITDLAVLTGPPRRRDVAIKNAERILTRRLKKYWTQDPSREFHLNVDQDLLRIRISDATQVFDFPEDRSLGSRWFISFYINFVSRIEGYPENAILLFDEPGIHVHPRGQRDLLPIFEEISAKYQLIYTTHLPFLINRNFPSRVRVIEKYGQNGTQINNKPHENRWKAIRSAVGLLAADSFVVGDTCLVVEGVSDHIYVAGLSLFLAGMGMPHLDMNETAVIPAATASDTVALARFAQAEKIPVVVLLDSDNHGDQAAEALQRDGFIEPSQIARVRNAKPPGGTAVQTFEDLLPLERFLEVVNRFYQERVPKFTPLSLADVRAAAKTGNAHVPTVSAIQRIFREKEIGDFDKRSVAEAFVRALPAAAEMSDDELKKLKAEFKDVSKVLGAIRTKLKDQVR